jgi:hypothetical protein
MFCSVTVCSSSTGLSSAPLIVSPWSFSLLDLNFHRLHQRGLGVRLEILNHPLRDEEKREDDADRDEQVISDADEIDPEVADGAGRMTRNSPNERRRSACRLRRTRNYEMPAPPFAELTMVVSPT